MTDIITILIDTINTINAISWSMVNARNLLDSFEARAPPFRRPGLP